MTGSWDLINSQNWDRRKIDAKRGHETDPSAYSHRLIGEKPTVHEEDRALGKKVDGSGYSITSAYKLPVLV